MTAAYQSAIGTKNKQPRTFNSCRAGIRDRVTSKDFKVQT